MTRALSWPRVMVEGVAIVASILLAFAIDAAWDRRQVDEERAAIVGALLTEFQHHRSDLTEQHDGAESRAAWIAGGLRELDRGVMDAAAVAVLDSAFYAVLNIADWDPGGGSLDATIASGRLEVLDSDQLQAHLASWHGVVDDVVDNQHLMQTFGLTVVVPTLSRKGLPLGRAWALRRSDWPDHDRDPPGGMSRTYSNLSRDLEVRSLMATKHAFLSSSVGDLERAIAMVDSILFELGEKAR